MNCGGNVLKSVLRWVIVRPSSKSSGFDKTNNKLPIRVIEKGGHYHEEVR